MSKHSALTIVTMFAVMLIAERLCAQLLILPPKQLSPTNLFDAEGVSIVINPINPDQLAAGSDVNYFYYSGL